LQQPKISCLSKFFKRWAKTTHIKNQSDKELFVGAQPKAGKKGGKLSY
jgi:hypothetical protein